MKEMFPPMIEKPDARVLCSGIPYWFFAYLLFPGLLSLMTVSSSRSQYDSWLEIGYHVVNFLVVLFLFSPYLKDSLLTVQVYTRDVLKTAVSCAVAVAGLKLFVADLCVISGNELFANAAYGSLLTNEADLLFYSTALVIDQPIWGTISLVILAPFTVTCLYYACVFAPICTSRPWLAYLIMALLSLLPRLSVAFCLWPLESEIAIYLLQLPVHLVACWSYQKTDTVWTPIAVHFLSNLFFAGFSLVFL